MTGNYVGSLPWAPSGPGGLTGQTPGGCRTLAQAAVEAETQFLTYLLENLRKSMVHSLSPPPAGMQGYQSLADQHLARAMALGGGLGLARRLFLDLGARYPEFSEETAHGAEPRPGEGDLAPARDAIV
jgi:Rod binding domain-containing protein